MRNLEEYIKGGVKVLPFYLFTLLLLLTSCKQDDDTVQEFPNWTPQNDAYFAQLLTDAQARIAAGDASWELIPSYSKPAGGYALRSYDYIVVQKLESSVNTTSPLLSDTAEVHYVGRLKESANVHKYFGMEFDRSYPGLYDATTGTYQFDLVTATPAKFGMAGVVNGFTTALLHMHRGDHWVVYIPYQLGYGTTARGSIPAGSTLIFDLRLADFWSKKRGDRD